MQAYRFALDLTAAQGRDLARHAGAARKAHNWALERVKAVMDQRAAERSYGILDDQLTSAVGWTLPALRREWNQAKGEVAPWWRECSKEAYNTGLDSLARALKNWSESRSGKRAGKSVGFPRRKTKRRTTASVRFTTGTIRVDPDRKHVTLPRVGRLKLHESARTLARRLDNGSARIMSATVRREGGRWHVSFTCEVERATGKPSRPTAVVGVDVGIHHLAVLSTGGIEPNPRHLDAARRRLRRLGRTLARRRGPYSPTTRSRATASKRWERASRQLSQAHARVANQRRDGLHKLTSQLAGEYGTVVVEDLNVAGMLRNRRLARAITDCGFGEIRRQLTYKTTWSSARLVTADRWYPSSKTRSDCRTVKPKPPLQTRTFTCQACGLTLDRDLNAARNLAQLVVTGSGSETVNKRGADPKTRTGGQVAVKRQPGTAPAGQTGTVPPQGGTADHTPSSAS